MFWKGHLTTSAALGHTFVRFQARVVGDNEVREHFYGCKHVVPTQSEYVFEKEKEVKNTMPYNSSFTCVSLKTEVCGAHCWEHKRPILCILFHFGWLCKRARLIVVTQTSSARKYNEKEWEIASRRRSRSRRIQWPRRTNTIVRDFLAVPLRPHCLETSVPAMNTFT